MSKKALVVSRENLSSPGGLARIVRYQIEILQSFGWAVEYVTPGQIVVPWASGRYPALNPFLETWQLSRLAHPKLSGVDALFTHGIYFPSLKRMRRVHLYHATLMGLAEACAPRLDWLEFAIQGQLGNQIERVSGLFSRRFAVSSRVQAESRRYHGFRDTGLLYNAVDVGHFRPQPKSTGKEFVGLCVGRLDYGKGSHLVRALGELLPAPHRLLLAGPRPGTIVWPGDRAVCLGPVDYAALPELYASADYILCPSRYEGFGMSVAEAWACDRPIISTNTGIVTDFVQQQECLRPLVVNHPDDAAGFAEKIEQLRQSPALGRIQAQWGREVVHQRFSLASLRKAYLHILQGL